MRGTRRTRRAVLAAAALSLGSGLALLAPAGPAVGQASPPLLVGVEVESPAALVARGAALTVPVVVICPGDATGQVSVSVSQRVGKSIATGGGYLDVTCAGSSQTVDVVVQASSGKAFRRGVAFASASAYASTDFNWGNAVDNETITVVR